MLTPLRMAHVDQAIVNLVRDGDDAPGARRWQLAQRLGTGGLLIERRGRFAGGESYLWLFAASEVPNRTVVVDQSGASVCLLSLPHLAVTSAAGSVPVTLAGMQVTRTLAARITVGDSITVGGETHIIESYRQDSDPQS